MMILLEIAAVAILALLVAKSVSPSSHQTMS